MTPEVYRAAKDAVERGEFPPKADLVPLPDGPSPYKDETVYVTRAMLERDFEAVAEQFTDPDVHRPTAAHVPEPLDLGIVDAHRRRLEAMRQNARDQIVGSVKSFTERLGQKPPNPKETIDEVDTMLLKTPAPESFTVADVRRISDQLQEKAIQPDQDGIIEVPIRDPAIGVQIPCSNMSLGGTLCVLPRNHDGLHQGDADEERGTYPVWPGRRGES